MQVKATVAQIIGIIQDDNLKGPENRLKREALVFEAAGKRFNFPLMARLALGKSWGRLNSEEKDRFVGLFTDLLENTYIRRIEGYSGEKIVYYKDLVKGDRALVYSLLVRNSSELSVIYKLRQEKEGWMIYDVLLEGASIIKQYRRQFAQLVAHEDIAGLFSRLEEKVKVIKR